MRRRAVLLTFYCLLATSACVAQDRRGPFTHSPRSVRSRDVDQQHVRLELAFNWDLQEIRGQAVLRLSPFKPVKQITLDAAEMKIANVALRADGWEGFRPLRFTTEKQSLTIDLGREFEAGEPIELKIAYAISQPTRGAHFVLPDQHEATQPRMVWTQSEPEFAHFWFPCIDTPADRLTSEILATVPAQFFVLSNGVLQGKERNGNGTQTWHWSQKKPHAPYLLSIVAGEFEAYEGTWDGIPIVAYLPRGRLADAARSFEKTPGMIQYFSEKIGYRYPWPKYAQICVDEYAWGGMEHTSATTLSLRTLHDQRAHLDVSSDNLVAHELAHQWFGNLVTCKDWAELWLNESCATYFATLWAEHDKGWDEATWARYRESESYQQEDRRYRRPIVTYRYNQPRNMFDRHSYPKGGRVLHMLRFELGDDLFWKAIQRYVEVNQFRTVETADLRRAIEDATGQGLNWFFEQWLYRGGHPEFDVSWQWDAAARLVRLTVKQVQKVDQLTPLFRTAVEIKLVSAGGKQLRRVTISKAEESFHLSADERPERVCFDPNDWILKTLKFDKSKEELLGQLSGDEHMICRIRAVQGLAGFQSHDDVRSALIAAAESDPFWAVRQQAAKALAGFKGEAVRNALRRAAANDPKSFVRREAISALGNFKHGDTNDTLRDVIQRDRSYYAIAAALKSLRKVDPENCAAELLAALRVASHQEVVLKAAADSLLELKEPRAETHLREQLDGQPTPAERVVLISALARLKPDDDKSFELLASQLGNARFRVRRSAVEAMGEIANSAALAALREHRGKEPSFRLVDQIDMVIGKIEARRADTDRLRREVDALRQQNKSLESRIKKLEEGE